MECLNVLNSNQRNHHIPHYLPKLIAEVNPSVACAYNVQSVKSTSSMLWISCKYIKNN